MARLQFCCYFLLANCLMISASTLKFKYDPALALNTDKAHEIMRMAKAAEMRNYMQTKVDPCEDFYSFACGNWQKINPAIMDQKTGLSTSLTKAYNRRAQQLLTGPKLTSENDMDRKVKYFYESCLNRQEVRQNYREKLLSIMEEFGGMPALKGKQWQGDKFDWLEVVAKILRKYGRQILIGVDIYADLTNNEVNRLYIGQLDDLVVSRAGEYYARLKIRWQMDMQQVMRMSVELASKTASELVDFERQLAVGIADPQEGLGMEDCTRLRMLDEMSESYKPLLNYTRFVGIWLGYEYRLPVYEYVDTYQRNLRKLIEITPKRIVANYIMWQLVQDFRFEAEDTDEKQAAKCVLPVKQFFIKYVDNMVYHQLLQHNDRTLSDVEEVWRELKRAFEARLKSNATAWMTPSTRTKALEKLTAIKLEVTSYESEDFAQEYGDLVITTESYFENIINILELRGLKYRQQLEEKPKLGVDNSYEFSPAYVGSYNKVLMPVAFLQPGYLFHDTYPTALKYATLGYIMAHEMAHAFDDSLRKFDAKGNLNNWWDRNSTEAFTQRLDCLRHQYGSYRYNGKKLHEVNAQGENVADNAGIRIAYSAYQRWLMDRQLATGVGVTDAGNGTSTDETLPNFDYTPRQLFFIGAAQVWCADVHRQFRQMTTVIDVHAPEQVRVVGMMANFDDFALEFKCRIGDKMHPQRKCVMY